MRSAEVLGLESKLHALLPNNKSDFQSPITQQSIDCGIFSTYQKIIDSFYIKDYEQCWQYSDILLDITWEKLNTGHWKDVSICYRETYTIATLMKVLTYFSRQDKSRNCVNDDVHELIKMCDMGMLMGSPIMDNILQRAIDILRLYAVKNTYKIFKRSSSENSEIPAKVPKFSNEVKRIKCPSLEFFRRHHLMEQEPVIITDSVSHWPASQKWSIDYIKHIAGHRTVPIELGSKYTDQKWSQKLMTIDHFIDTYILNPGEIGYLAQHQLFDQIPELKNDIVIPDYCCLGDEDVDINAWFGPRGTVSPLHYDPKHNLLVQVFGEKFIRLYHEKFSENLYPHEDKLLFNTSRVDVENPDLTEFPLFSQAEYTECVLRPGDMLYIPPRCWHYVRSLSVSFSVSFWFEYNDDFYSENTAPQ